MSANLTNVSMATPISLDVKTAAHNDIACGVLFANTTTVDSNVAVAGPVCSIAFRRRKS